MTTKSFPQGSGSRPMPLKLIAEEVALHDVDDDGAHPRSKSRMALHLPMRGWVKLSIVEPKYRHHEVKWGVVARDWNGGWFVSFSLYSLSSNMFWAISKALEWAQSRHLQNVTVESDSSVTIDRLHHEDWSSPLCPSDMAARCRSLLSKAKEVRLQHRPLEPEQVAKVLTAVTMIWALVACPSDGAPYYVLDMVLREFACLQ